MSEKRITLLRALRLHYEGKSRPLSAEEARSATDTLGNAVLRLQRDVEALEDYVRVSRERSSEG